MPNLAPTASVVVLASGTPTQSARFDISASRDPEGRLARWKLEFGDDTAFEGHDIPPEPISHQYAAADRYDATLTVWDQSHRSDSMTVPVVVAADVQPVPDPTPTPEPEPTPEPTQTPEPEPTPDPVPEPQPVPDPTPAPTPEPTPDPVPDPTPAPVPDPSPSGRHANYLAILRRPDLFRAYSMRPNPLITDKAHPDYGKQLLAKKLGGYAETDVLYDTTYDASTPWDAACLTIPEFARGASTTLASALSASADDTNVFFAKSFGDMKATRRFMVDDEEIETVTSAASSTAPITMQVKRAVNGVLQAHAAGAACRFNSNSAYNNIRLPLGTQDGHTYIFRIDTLHTDSYVQMNDPGLHVLTNHKWLNYISDGIWFEPDAQYSGGTVEANNSKGWTPTQPPGFNRSTDVAAFQIRSYNALGGKAAFADNPVYAKGYAGPGVLNNDSLIPQLATFIIKPNRVVRHWMVIDQRANDYSRVSYAIADETTGIIWTHKDVPLTVRQSVKSVQELVLEFNTSTYAYSHNRPLVSYFGDMAAFKDPAGDLLDIYTPPSNAEWAR